MTFSVSTAGFDPAASACEADVLPNELRPQSCRDRNRTDILLSLLFIIIYSLPNHTSGVIQEVLSTGIHVPVLLGVAGFMLSKYKPQLSNEIKRNTFLVVSIALNVDYIALNWKIALFILSIILGKFIWIDFVFDSQNIVKSLRAFQNSDELCDLLIKVYGQHSIGLFYAMFISYSLIENTIQIPSGHTRFIILASIYVSFFMIYMSFMSRFNPQESDEKKKGPI